MARNTTRYDRVVRRLKNNRVTVAVLIIGVAVIALASLTKALDDIGAFFGKHAAARSTASATPPAQITSIGAFRRSRVNFKRNELDVIQDTLIEPLKSATVNVFFDDSMDRLLSIPIGYATGAVLSADCIGEQLMRGRVELTSKFGRLELLTFETRENSYAKHFTVDPSAYEGRAGIYTILVTLETASGTLDTASLELDVRAPTAGNHAPVVEVSSLDPLFSGMRFSQHVFGRDLDADQLSYSFVQAPSWLRIDRLTGQVRGRVPPVDSSYQFVYTVRVSDGKDFALRSVVFNVYANRRAPP